MNNKFRVVCGFGLAASFIATRSHELPQKQSGPHVGAAHRTFVRRVLAHQLGRYLSPDGQYLAQVTIGEAEVKGLTLYAVHPKKTSSKAPIIPEVDDVQGFAWVPGRPHTLIISADGSDYGKAMLALWRGGKTLANLVVVKDHTPDAEGFRLICVSADGRTVYYEHTQDAEKLIGLDKIRALKLPHP